MNRMFKRVISSVLAFVMVMSCVMVMNVSTALANNITMKYELYGKDKSEWQNSEKFDLYTDTVNTNNFFKKVKEPTQAESNNYGYNATTIDGNSVPIKTGIKLDSNHPSFTIPEGASNIKVNYAFSANKANEEVGVKFGSVNGNKKYTATTAKAGYEVDEVTLTNAGTYEIANSTSGQAILLYVMVSFEIDENTKSISLSPKDLDIVRGSTGKITVETVGDVGEITWSSDVKEITVDGTATSATVTVPESVAAGTKATITAKPANCDAATATVNVTTVVEGTSGTVDNLAVTDKTTLYDLRAEAEKAGFGEGYQGDCYIKGNTYFDNHVASVGSGSVAFQNNKSAHDIDGTSQSHSLRLKSNSCALAVKIPAGSTIETKFTNGSGSETRYGGFVFDSNDLKNIKSGLDKAKGEIVEIAHGQSASLSYTNDTEKDKVIYISSSSDMQITQIQVTVPESLAENEVKGVAYGTKYVVFGISKEQATKYSSYKIEGGTADGGSTVYTGVDFGSGDVKTAAALSLDTDYCVAYKFENVNNNLNALVEAVKLSLQ